MRGKTWIAMLALLCGLTLAGASAHAVIIDFGNANDPDFDPGDSHVEDGFIFTVVSGENWGLTAAGGNPPSALEVGNQSAIGVGDTLLVQRLDGGRFTFDAFDVAAAVAGAAADAVDFLGFHNAVQTESLLGITSSSPDFVTIATGFSDAIDELRIVGAAAGASSLGLDNFVLAPVPAPVPIALTAFGLFGIARPRHRRMATAATARNRGR